MPDIAPAASTMVSPAPERPSDAREQYLPLLEESPTERQLVEWVYQLNEEADSAIRDEAAFENWDEWVRAYWGVTEVETYPSYRPPVKANELKRHILQEVSDLTDSDLRIFVTKDPKGGQRDKDVENAMRAYWVRNFVWHEVMLAQLFSFIGPGGFIVSAWDPWANGGQGEIITRARDPRTVKPDKLTLNDRDWVYVILEDRLDLQTIRRMWPDRGKYVRPEDTISRRYPDDVRTQSSISRNFYVGPMTAWHRGVDARSEGYQLAASRVLTLFVRDDAVEEEPEVLRDDGGAAVAIRSMQRRKYPNGRMIQVANNVLLYDGPVPRGYRIWPITRFQSQPSPGRFWHSSTIGDVMSLQDNAERLLGNIVENGIRLNNGIVLTTADSGIDAENFAAIPGQIVVINPGAKFEILYPNAMPADMVNAPRLLLDLQSSVLGMPGSRTGEQRRGNVAAELSETEISQAQSLTRLRARLSHMSIQRMAEIIFCMMAEFYKTPRFLPHSEGGEWKPVAWQPIADPRGYAVHCDPASLKPMSQTMLKRIVPHLYKLGVVGRRYVLRTLEMPDYEEAVKEKEAGLAQMAQAMALRKMRGK